VGLNHGAWTAKEDKILSEYIKTHGLGPWNSLAKKAGLKRCGKSCRLRWLNYLRPDIKRGNISPEEEELLIRLHLLLGNRWSLIAGRLPGRTDNELKNYWNTHLSKRFEKSHVPSYSNNEKAVEDNYNHISQNTPLTTRADRNCGRVIVDVGSHNYDYILDTHDVIHPQGEELKAADDHFAETDIDSKSWSQLLLENTKDQLEVINDLQANSIISISFGTDHHLPYPSPNPTMFLQERHSSSFCNFDNHELSHLEDVHSTYLQSLLDLSWFSFLP
jgi:hypothetical protein